MCEWCSATPSYPGAPSELRSNNTLTDDCMYELSG